MKQFWKDAIKDLPLENKKMMEEYVIS